MSGTASSWSWANLPTGETLNEQDATHIPGDYDHDNGTFEEGEHVDEEEAPPQPEKHYPTRTCRICLEEVLPTFDGFSAGLPSMLHPKPRVRYVSDDPTSGRLIRPCKCRGTQQYVHEGCLKAWRYSDSSFGARTFWECPTCKFKYNLERMKWGRFLSSTFLQIGITIAIMWFTVFLFGFVADPIIRLYLDPYETITSLPTGGAAGLLDYEDGTWAEHFLKGLASLGLLSFIKVFFAMSPWNWWNLRRVGAFGGGRRRGGTGRERLEDISWTVVIIGVVTFLVAVWSWVRAWTASLLEKGAERVLDVSGDDGEDEVEETGESIVKPDAASEPASTPQNTPPSTAGSSETESETRKTK